MKKSSLVILSMMSLAFLVSAQAFAQSASVPSQADAQKTIKHHDLHHHKGKKHSEMHKIKIAPKDAEKKTT